MVTKKTKTICVRRTIKEVDLSGQKMYFIQMNVPSTNVGALVMAQSIAHAML